jgi:hypothetical protein
MISLDLERGILSEREFFEISKEKGERIQYNKVPYYAVELFYTDIKIVCLTAYDIFYSSYTYYFFTPSQYSAFKEKGVDITTLFLGIDISTFAFLKIDTFVRSKRLLADITFYNTSIYNDYRELEVIEENEEMWLIGYLCKIFFKKIQVNIIISVNDTHMLPVCRSQSYLFQILATTESLDNITVINEFESTERATSELSSLLHTIRTTPYRDTTIGAFFKTHPSECKVAMEMIKDIPEVTQHIEKVLTFLQSRIIYPNPIRRIIAVLAHGCDIPYPIENPYHTRMLSSVVHGCVNIGNDQDTLNVLFHTIKDKNSVVEDTIHQIKSILTQKAIATQKHRIMLFSPLPKLDSDFSYLEEDTFYRIHKPVGDRHYTFYKFNPEVERAEVPGIYVLYSDNIEELNESYHASSRQQKSNILNPDCAPSLQKYHDIISKKIVKNSVTLSDIISSFRGELYVIDTACRVTCDERSYTKQPRLQRIPSIDLGAKKRIKRKTKTKKRLIKRKHKRTSKQRV